MVVVKRGGLLVFVAVALGPIFGLVVGGRGFVAQHAGVLMLGGLLPLVTLALLARIAHAVGKSTWQRVRDPQPLGESGAAFAEFVIVIIPFLMMMFALMQLALAAMARVLVAYAAFCAARAAIVFVPMSGGDVSSIAAVPGEANSNEAVNSVGSGGNTINDMSGSKKAELIRNAAAYALIPASPPIDTFLGDAAANWASYLGQRLEAGLDPTNYLTQSIGGLPSLPPTIVNDLTSVMNAANQNGLSTPAQRAAAESTVDNWLQGAITDPTLRAQIAQAVANYYNGTGGGAGASSATGSLASLVNSTLGSTLTGGLNQYLSQISTATNGTWGGFSVDRALDSGLGSSTDVSGALPALVAQAHLRAAGDRRHAHGRAGQRQDAVRLGRSHPRARDLSLLLSDSAGQPHRRPAVLQLEQVGAGQHADGAARQLHRDRAPRFLHGAGRGPHTGQPGDTLMNRTMERLRARLSSSLRRLDRDEAGNVIVLYIAAALLLVGMVWAIIGTGQRVVQKETIQTSADAAAFSAAVIKAKGMNIIAFCNLVMALLMAVIMLLRLINDALIVAVAFALALSWTGAGAALASALQTAQQEYQQLDNQIEPRILDVMNAFAELERAVQESFPALSLVEAYQVGTHSEYQQNFGKGQLVTIAWPLPVGNDLKLPAQDGTFREICDHGAITIGQMIAIPLQKLGLSGDIATEFASTITSLISPLEDFLCPSDGSSAGSSTAPLNNMPGNCTSCDSCNPPQPTQQPASNIQFQSSTYTGNTVNSDGSTSTATATCTTSGAFDSSGCNSGSISCSDGSQLKNAHLVSASYTYTGQVSLGAPLSGNKPKPLDITSDWHDHSQVRAFTLLTDTNMNARRAWAGISTKNLGSAPALNQMLGMSQAEFFAFNGNADLWHMDWRARLVRFTFGDTSQTNTGGASGVPTGGASAITGALSSFLQNDATAGLADQFLLH